MASFGHNFLLAEKDGKVNDLNGLDGRHCFDTFTGLNCTLSDSILIVFKLKLDKSLDGLVRASITTSLCDKDFSDKESLSPKALMHEVTLDTSQVVVYFGRGGHYYKLL